MSGWRVRYTSVSRWEGRAYRDARSDWYRSERAAEDAAEALRARPNREDVEILHVPGSVPLWRYAQTMARRAEQARAGRRRVPVAHVLTLDLYGDFICAVCGGGWAGPPMGRLTATCPEKPLFRAPTDVGFYGGMYATKTWWRWRGWALEAGRPASAVLETPLHKRFRLYTLADLRPIRGARAAARRRAWLEQDLKEGEG